MTEDLGDDRDLVDRLRAEYSALPVTADIRLDELAAGARRRRRMLAAIGAAAAVVLVAGGAALWAGLGGSGDPQDPDAAATSGSPTGTSEPLVEFTPATIPYDGPLSAPGRFGAAGQAVVCRFEPTGFNRTTDVYRDGATSPTPTGALDTAYSEGLFLDLPQLDLRLAASSPDRQMLTYEARGRILVALVVHDGPAAEGTGGDGWYLESFARCDFAEFPEEVAEIPGIASYGAWTDADGNPVPVRKVYTSPGPEHCNWQDMTFMILGDRPGPGLIYIEDPIKELRRYLTGPYLTGIPLPDDAVDTGWQREGRRLWLASDESYAYVGSPESVDAWPRFDSACL